MWGPCRKLAKKAERARYAPFMAGGSPHAGLPIGFAEFDAAGIPDSGAMHAMQARQQAALDSHPSS